jgi:hypothetical protein
MRGISWLAEELSGSLEGLCSMELRSLDISILGYPCIWTAELQTQLRLFLHPYPMSSSVMLIAIDFRLSFPWRNSTYGPGPPHYRNFTITLTHTILGRTTLNKWSARRRDLYLTTHIRHRQYAPGGNRIRNPCKWATADQRIRPRGPRERPLMFDTSRNQQNVFLVPSISHVI